MRRLVVSEEDPSTTTCAVDKSFTIAGYRLASGAAEGAASAEGAATKTREIRGIVVTTKRGNRTASTKT